MCARAVSAAGTISDAILEQLRQRGSERRLYDGSRHYLWLVENKVHALAEFLGSAECLSANSRTLLVAGNAGTGKTHTLCDVASARQTEDRATVLVLGQHFAQGEPIAQIVRSLGLECAPAEFLAALDTAGEVRQQRGLLLIDAINEGEGRYIWRQYLAGVLVELRKYQWIGLAISVRKNYESDVLPQNAPVVETMTRYVHRGFDGVEDAAVSRYFSHYRISRPGAPLLHPEFSNPLFLQLFCRGMKNLGLTEVPTGFEGITFVFQFFLDSIDQVLARKLDYDANDHPVRQAVELLATAMVGREQDWLQRSEAKQTCDAVISREGFERSLFRNLVSEGVLTEDRLPLRDGQDVVRFQYQRLGDHLRAQALLTRYKSRVDLEQAFNTDSPVARLFSDIRIARDNAGVIAALAEQIPERFGVEMTSLAPVANRWPPIVDAMIESLVWRRSDSFSNAFHAYLNDVLLQPPYLDGTWSALLTVAYRVNHPFNAHALHGSLLTLSMPERDAWWTVTIHRGLEEGSSLLRLLSWLEHDGPNLEMGNETALLTGIVLSWLLASPNRFLRDRATLALVRLFEKRLSALCELLLTFAKVDDLYVLERLVAVACGCSTRSMVRDQEGVGQLALTCYGMLFEGEPPANILLRDYARIVVEAGLKVRPSLPVERTRIVPPFRSIWPTRLPATPDLKRLYDSTNAMHWSQREIISSVMHGDFALYVVGTNSGSFEWLPVRLGRTPAPTARERYDAFIASLTPEQEVLWVKTQPPRKTFQVLLQFRSAIEGGAPESAKQNSFVCSAADRAQFIASLTQGQRTTFQRFVAPYIESGPPAKSEPRFDLSLLQRFIIQRVFQMGWTAERFGEFDRMSSGSTSREARKAERMGKKYQWLAYYEALARIADNFVYRGHSWSKQPQVYRGTWQMTERNIDPTLTARGKPAALSRNSAPWWHPPAGDEANWAELEADEEWLRNRKDWPKFARFPQCFDPADRSSWLMMDGIFVWQQSAPAHEEGLENPRRERWVKLRSYVVRRADLGDVMAWAINKKSFVNFWAPNEHSVDPCFFGELYWSPAYLDHKQEVGDPWHDQGGFPAKVAGTCEYYSSSISGFDCSREDGVGVAIPSGWLAEQMGLRWNGVDGQFVDAAAGVVARDPSVFEAGRSALLLRQESLSAFLEKNDFSVMWCLLGEKGFIGGGDRWRGSLEVNGAFTIEGNRFTGGVHFTDKRPGKS